MIRRPRRSPLFPSTTLSRSGIRVAVLATIRAAQRSIDIEMFVLSDRLVLDALIAAARHGIQVRAVLDPTQPQNPRSEEHTSELQSQSNLVCRLLLEKKKT